MYTKKIKATILSFATAAIATFGLAACDKGTEPGETNVERSEIRDEGELIGEEGENITRYSDTTDLEKYYDDADHENHADGEEGSAVHAGDGKGEGIKRDEVQ